jgi:hypothetical protein
VRLFLPLAIAGALLVSGCYNQPIISPQRPLRCNPAETKGQCPNGFACATTGVCGPQSCKENADCPAGLVCTNRGCVAPPDAGITDGAIQIPNQPDGAVKPSEIDGNVPDDVLEPDVATPLLDGGEG